MRKLVILVLLAAHISSAFAAKPPITNMVTVEQLEQALAKVHGGWDGSLAKRISEMKLIERLSASRLALLEKNLPGRQSREQLRALADEAAFLELPAAEIPTTPAPSADDQAAMLARTAGYVTKTVAAWPSFSATRVTTRLEGTTTVISADMWDQFFSYHRSRTNLSKDLTCPETVISGYRRLTVLDRTSVEVVYRRGREIHTFGDWAGEFDCPKRGLSTMDEFGDVPSWVPRVLAEGKVTWGHWEQGTSGLLAAFRYSAVVSYKKQIWHPRNVTVVPTLVEVRGEFAVDPTDGSIRRLTETRRWTHTWYRWIVTLGYDNAVEYGPVAIDGVTCILPLRRAAVFLTPILLPKGTTGFLNDDQIYKKYHLTESPLQEYVNDVNLVHYSSLAPANAEAGDSEAEDATPR